MAGRWKTIDYSRYVLIPRVAACYVVFIDGDIVELRLIRRLKPPHNCFGSTKKRGSHASL